MSPREAPIDRAIARHLTNKGAYQFKTTGVAVAGIPDRIAIYRGRPLAIEVKAPGNQPTPRQRRQLQLAQRAGATTIVAHSVDDVRQALNQIDLELDQPGHPT